MRKNLKFQFLSSIFFLSTFENCSSEKNQNSSIVSSRDKLYSAGKNMLTFINENLENKNFNNLCSLKFADLFVNSLAERSESEQRKSSVDNNLKSLFTNKNNKDSNVIDYLQGISKKIKEEKSKASVFVMGNTDDKSFESLGKSFESKGIEYALIFSNDRDVKFFLSDSSSINNFLIDERGNIFDKKRWKEEIRTLGNNVQCIVVPILHLEVKAGSNFVQLGEYQWGAQALSMFFSLIGSQIYAVRNKDTKKGNVYLYVNEEDRSAWLAGNVGFDNLLQSSGVSKNYLCILDGLSKFIASGINWIKKDDENYIVFSSKPYVTSKKDIVDKKYKFEDLLNKIKDFKSILTPDQSINDDIFCNVFYLLKSKVEDKKNIRDKIEEIETEIKKLKSEGEATEEKEKEINKKQEELLKIPYLKDKSLKVVRIYMGEQDHKVQIIEWEDDGNFRLEIKNIKDNVYVI